MGETSNGAIYYTYIFVYTFMLASRLGIICVNELGETKQRDPDL